MTDLEAKRDEQVGLNEALEAERRRSEETSARTVEKQREEARRALTEVLSEFREQSRKEIEAVRDRKEKAKVEKEQARAESRLRSSLASAERRVAAPAPVPDILFEPRPGVIARIRSLDREGEILEVRGTKAEVRMGSTTFTVALSDLAAAVGREGSAKPPKPSPRAPRAPVRDDLTATPPQELHLLGKTVDEALPEVDKYLDDAALAAMTEVRVVHGHGTGRLRTAIRAFLSRHPHVASWRPGEPREGGDGATIVTLR
jgi:DNA mismatch repair protein MutS2